MPLWSEVLPSILWEVLCMKPPSLVMSAAFHCALRKDLIFWLSKSTEDFHHLPVRPMVRLVLPNNHKAQANNYSLRGFRSRVGLSVESESRGHRIRTEHCDETVICNQSRLVYLQCFDKEIMGYQLATHFLSFPFAGYRYLSFVTQACRHDTEVLP